MNFPILALTLISLVVGVTGGSKSCKHDYQEGITYFGEQVKLVGNILTPGECSAICSEEPACAFWSHLADRRDCRIWSSDVVRSKNEHSKNWVSGERCR